MKLNPKYVLGLITLVIIGALLLLKNYSQENKLVITSQNNSFSLNLQAKDTEEINTILAHFQTSVEGINNLQFELDSTTSAKLYFKTPIATTFNVDKKKVKFTGQLNSFVNSTAQHNYSFKIPPSTNLAIYSTNLNHFFRNNSQIAPEFTKVIEKISQGTAPQAMAIYDKDAHIALMLKGGEASEEMSRSLAAENSLDFKKEEKDNVTFFIFNANDTEKKYRELYVFKIGEVLFIASSKDAADQMILAQKGALLFPKMQPAQQPSLELIYINSLANPAFDEFKSLIFQNPVHKEKLSKVEKAEFMLTGRKFRGNLSFY